MNGGRVRAPVRPDPPVPTRESLPAAPAGLPAVVAPGSRTVVAPGSPVAGAARHFFLPDDSSLESTAMNASCGTSTLPTIFIRFLPSFCFSSSLRFREMSPP